MVAEATKKPDRERTRGKFKEIPVLIRLKARNLYLIQGLSHQEIAAQTGLTRQSSEALAHREGWVKVKRERTKRLVEKYDSRVEAAGNEAIDAIADVSTQLSMEGLGRVSEALQDRSQFAARDFQSWTGGVKNLVSIMREIRAPSETTPGNAGLVAFVIRVGDEAPSAPAKTEVNVTPVVTHNTS